MQNHNHDSQPPESPRSVLPPLSKYYYGPAQGRASPQRIAHEDGSGRGSTSPAAAAPPLPPRHPATTEPFSASRWMNHFASTEQLWHLPGPPKPTSSVSQMGAAYNPSTYGPMPGYRPQTKAAGPTGHQPDISNWGEDHGKRQGGGSENIPKPPLPPRPSALAPEAPAQQSFSGNNPSNEYLPPLSYDPTVAQSTFDHNPATVQGSPNVGTSPLPPHRLPPAPPPKLPPDEENGGGQPSQEIKQHPLTFQTHQPLSLSTQEQSQHLRRYDPVKDHITYSIPSSIWRQDQAPHYTEPAPSQPNPHNEPQRSDSFYWQSPHSSTHSIKDESDDIDTATAAKNVNLHQLSAPESDDQCKTSDTIVTSSLLSHSTLGTYGASALGFGGPSDWEHFGDYEAEEIDDTELYTRPKPSINQIAKPESAELPASLSDAEPHYQSNPAKSQSDSSSPASTKGSVNNDQKGSSIETKPEVGDVADPMEHEENQDSGFSGDTAAEHDALSTGIRLTIPTSDVLEDDTFATSLHETIQAWSRASSTENIDVTKPAESAIEHPENLAPGSRSSVYALDPDTAAQNGSTPASLDSGATSDAQKLSDDVPGQKHDTPGIQDNAALLQHESLNLHSTVPPTISEAEPPIDSKPASTSREESDGIKDLSHAQPAMVASSGSSARAKGNDDPYAGLDAWGKASLNRYIAMLREESEALTDKEKLNIFTVFTSRETRLRAVLYGAESEPLANQATPTRTGSIKRASTTAFKRASKALPALPGEDSRTVPTQSNGHVRKSSVKLSAATILGAPKPKPAALQALDTTNSFASGKVESPTDSPTDLRFSPGGRPIVSRAVNVDRMSYSSEQETLAMLNGDRSSGIGNPKDLPEPSSATQAQQGQIATDDASAYKPFKYNEGRSEARNYAANRQSKRQSQFRPYAAKTMDSDEYRDMFLADRANIGLKDGVTAAENGPQAEINAVENANPDLRRFVRADFDPLLSVLPESGEIHTDASQFSNLRQVADAVPDDFSFIHQSVVAWDGKARRQREINERERHARQMESEQKIDALFDDHEIGYGDISELESGFKRSEAARKADEDRSEYKTFVAEVFNIVWARLHYEIDQLNPHYNEHTKMLNDSTAGKDMFDLSGKRFALAPTMDALLTLHQKLEIRHQKAFEAVLERDRRLKKTELSPWYSLGNVTKVKQLERQFEDAEKKAIVEYCRQRDIRANDLMDVLDQNTLRGVGANQDYMEMVMKAVRRIASGRAFASQSGGGEPGVGLEEVTRAKSVTKALATSSEQIVQTFHVADMLLNAADYELSVAKAKLSGADTITFQTLKEERAKEDQKLMRDLEHRLALIREDSRRTNDEIVKLLLFLGVQSGHAGASSAVSQEADLGHEERLHRALEEAKRRNGLEEAGTATVL